MGKSFRFHEAPIVPFSLNFPWKHSSATIPTNLSHLGLVRQIRAVTSGFLQTLFLLLLPHFPNPAVSPFCPPLAPGLTCRSHGKGALLFATHLQDAQHRARSSGWSYREGASWEFAQHIPLWLQLRNQSERPRRPHGASASVLCTFTFCRQALSNQTVKYPSFYKVQWLLLCSQTPLCALVVTCTALGASWKSQNVSTEEGCHRAGRCRRRPEVGTTPAAATPISMKIYRLKHI